MASKSQGSIRLFQIAGINVFLHWSWFLVAIFEIQSRRGSYSSITWNVLEYLALFLIVLLHEFGHSLACRQVGGQANQIVLWPLGGIAYVSPPQRPGATLWSISAGPLVNVLLLVVLSLLGINADLALSLPNVAAFLSALWTMNLWILIFNLLPIYPLDGGQIVRSLLWFIVGRATSLMIAAILGFVGVGGMLLIAFFAQSIWLGILAVFVLLNCWNALTHARALAKMAKIPRREGFMCPYCKTQPPRGALWICPNCRKPFDTFETNASCPYCGAVFSTTACPECNEQSAIAAWSGLTPAGKGF